MRAFRIVLAGHGELPSALLETARMICGNLPEVVALGLAADETPDAYATRLRSAIGHDGRPVLVLADLLGGTPYNVSAAISRRSPRVVCLSGANLPMVIEAALASAELDESLVDRLIEAGRSGIVETERHRASRAS